MTAGRLRCCGVLSWAIVGQVLACLALLCSAPSEAAPQCPVLELNGSRGYATASSTVFPNTTSLVSFTAEAWIYRRDFDSQVILSDDAWDLLLQDVPGITGLVVRLYAAPGTVGTVVGETFYDQRSVGINKWHHVALVFDAATKQLRIALDGVVGSPRIVDLTSFAKYSSNFIVGAFPTNSYFNGYIDDIRISDVARYSANFTPPTSLKADANTRALYQFFEASGATTFADASGNGKTLTGTGGAQTGTAAGTCLVTQLPVYRFVNVNTGGHFFTISETEKNDVLQNKTWFRSEGVGFDAYATQKPGTLPVYRFFNTPGQGYFYTIYESEKNNVIQNNKEFTYEGVAFYAYPTQQPDTLPLYRFQNTRASAHFFTIYESEKDTVIQNYNWFLYEGVGFYVYLRQSLN